MAKVPISVCIIAKNEEKYIEGCLKRLKPHGFEIIVTDTGSTDRTKEIAAKYADKVLDFKWIDDFSAARNFCAEHASYNWILSIDCDEYLEEINVPQIRILTQKFPHALGMIHLTNIVLENGKEKYGKEKVVRFYNKKHFVFCNKIHEQILLIDKSKVDVYNERFIMPMEVIHHGYAIGPEEMKKKQKRNLDMLAKSLETNPDDPYVYFQMGQSNYVIGNYEEAVECYKKALSYNPKTTFDYVQILIVGLANAYKRLARFKEALELMDKYADECKTARYVFVHAIVNYDNDEILKALVLFIKATILPDANTLGENLLDCYNNIIGIYLRMGEPEMADMYKAKYEECLAERERVLNS